MAKVWEAYSGYLKPVVPEILQRFSVGHGPKRIAADMQAKIAPLLPPGWDGEPYPEGAVASLINTLRQDRPQPVSNRRTRFWQHVWTPEKQYLEIEQDARF